MENGNSNSPINPYSSLLAHLGIEECYVKVKRISEDKMKEFKSHAWISSPPSSPSSEQQQFHHHRSIGKPIHLFNKDVCKKRPRGRPRKESRGEYSSGSPKEIKPKTGRERGSAEKMKKKEVKKKWSDGGLKKMRERDSKGSSMDKVMMMPPPPPACEKRFASVPQVCYPLGVSYPIAQGGITITKTPSGTRSVSSQSQNTIRTYGSAREMNRMERGKPSNMNSMNCGASTSENGAKSITVTMKMGRVVNVEESSVPSGKNWVNELLSTNMAEEVVNEAANSVHYLPDVSVIQRMTGMDKDSGSVFPNFDGHSGLPAAAERSNDASQSRKTQDKTVQHGKPTKISRESSTFSFEFYEHLYKNDILLINAEDDAVPLPL